MTTATRASLVPTRGAAEDTTEVTLTLTVAGQLCGVPVSAVRDVLAAQSITRIPLAPLEVAGGLNLRGRIVTAIDLRRRLGLPAREGGVAMSVVVEREGEAYSLLADQVGEVLPLPRGDRAPNPPTLDPAWREVSLGVHRLGERLLIMLDVEQLLAIAA
ncbi:chemotaxis protein CheW [Roseicella aquatilis]|uniref:Chemotaxis protein CheW n=1 Tax=Roseicella aquatilis TaxID=2527868 RepID=A0A4R4DGG9_9PROT|nr:chemotaxis protein CheW [Roseicella aquatilis]TCZ58627.1 chemotaxis protein CheW [Roseicella aquatilis]